MRDNRRVAGHSSTPLARKLGIREGHRVALVDAPDAFAGGLEGLPPGVLMLASPRAPLDVVVVFVRSRADLERRAGPLSRLIFPAGGLWVAWPRRASGIVTDVGEADVRGHGLVLGLVDNKVCAVDDTWSALRLVYRLADRKVPGTDHAPGVAGS